MKRWHCFKNKHLYIILQTKFLLYCLPWVCLRVQHFQNEDGTAPHPKDNTHGKLMACICCPPPQAVLPKSMTVEPSMFRPDLSAIWGREMAMDGLQDATWSKVTIPSLQLHQIKFIYVVQSNTQTEPVTHVLKVFCCEGSPCALCWSLMEGNTCKHTFLKPRLKCPNWKRPNGSLHTRDASQLTICSSSVFRLQAHQCQPVTKLWV